MADMIISQRFDDLGKDGARVRLGIMGGTFDPIHIGHLACAEQAREAFSLDAVIFIPAGCPVYKKDQRITCAHARLEMCAQAVRSNPAFDVSAIEVNRAGDTYTVDTLRELRSHYPDNVELFFITGADAALNIVRWHESAQCASLCRFIAVTRPGFKLTEEHKRAFSAESGFLVDFLEVTALAISSSDLRARVREGKSIRYLTMACVNDYIKEHGLYLESAYVGGGLEKDASSADDLGKRGFGEDVLQEDVLQKHITQENVLPDSFACEDDCGVTGVSYLEFYDARHKDLEGRVSARRLSHIEGVALTSEKLARIYGENTLCARLAGLLHDWDKNYDDEGIRHRVDELGLQVDPYVYTHEARLLHGPTAAAALSRDFPQISASVISAISRHTTASCDMTPLDMIVYVADVIEPTRTFDEVEALRSVVGKVSLEELFFRAYTYTMTSVIAREKNLYPNTVDVWNHYADRARARAHKIQ